MMAEQQEPFEYPLVSRWFVDPLVYNMTPQEYYGDEYQPDLEDFRRFVCSVCEPPTQEFNGDTWDVVAAEFSRCIRNYITLKHLPTIDVYNEPVWPEYSSSGDEIEDYFNSNNQIGRVLMLYPLRDPRILSREFVAVVQEQLLSAYPLWCVYIMDDYEEDDLMIYPNAIRSVSMTTDEATTNHFDSWLVGYRERHERANGPERRQILWIKRVLPDAVARLGLEDLSIIGHFDNSRGKFAEHIVWTLQRQSEFDQYLAVSGNTPSLIQCRSPGRPVNKNGYLMPMSKRNDQALSFLVPWVYNSKNTIVDYAIMDRATHVVGSGRLTDNPIITDNELKAWERSQHSSDPSIDQNHCSNTENVT